MSDIVKELLFRASDENGIGWTPNTIVHVPAGLLHQAADEIERLRAALRDVHATAKDNHLIANIARAALGEKE